MTVLVVGGAGYIGSVVVEELIRARHSVIVLDDFSTGHRDAVAPLAYVIEGAMQEPRVLREAFETKEIDGVVHLAGRSLVAESVAHPERYEESNVAWGARLLDAMEEHGVRDLVFSSTAAVYDPRAAMPLVEESPLKPENPYGATKLRFERMLEERSVRGTLRYVALRYFNVGGASIDRGEDHREETHLIPLLIDAARGASGPVSIYGTDYPTRDGTAVRDYVHVVDVAEAHVRALRRLADGGGGAAVNLGSEAGATVREVVEAVRRVTGRSVPTRDAARRAGDPPVLIAACDRARSVLGWRPMFSSLPEIVETAWEWRLRYPEGYAQ